MKLQGIIQRLPKCLHFVTVQIFDKSTLIKLIKMIKVMDQNSHPKKTLFGLDRSLIGHNLFGLSGRRPEVLESEHQIASTTGSTWIRYGSKMSNLSPPEFTSSKNVVGFKAINSESEDVSFCIVCVASGYYRKYHCVIGFSIVLKDAVDNAITYNNWTRSQWPRYQLMFLHLILSSLSFRTLYKKKQVFHPRFGMQALLSS